jgi:hypothetical protein
VDDRRVTEPDEGLTDEQVGEQWGQIASGTNRMMERVGDPNEFPLASGSSLFGDDKHSDPYHVSHTAQACLVAGVDHLHTAKSHLLDFGVLPAQSLFSVIRGALENFAAAYWILHPRLRNDRVERTLRWHAKNFKDQKTALEPLGLADETTRDAKLAKLDAIATPRGISTASVRSVYTSTSAVQYCELNAPRGRDVVFAWRLCSGFAHGRPWAYLGMSERNEQFETTDPKVVKLKLTSNPDRVLYPAQQAYLLMIDLVELLQARAVAPFPHLSEEIWEDKRKALRYMGMGMTRGRADG